MKVFIFLMFGLLVACSNNQPETIVPQQDVLPVQADKKDDATVQPMQEKLAESVMPVAKKPKLEVQEKVIAQVEPVETDAKALAPLSPPIDPKQSGSIVVADKVVVPAVQTPVQPVKIVPEKPKLEEVALGNAEAGKAVAKKCLACHTFDQGGKHKAGPNLFGIVGTKQGGVAGFKYGSYLTESNAVWDEVTLRAWVSDAKAVANAVGKNTKMPSQKIDGEKADDLIAYLRSLR